MDTFAHTSSYLQCCWLESLTRTWVWVESELSLIWVWVESDLSLTWVTSFRLETWLGANMTWDIISSTADDLLMGLRSAQYCLMALTSAASVTRTVRRCCSCPLRSVSFQLSPQETKTSWSRRTRSRVWCSWPSWSKRRRVAKGRLRREVQRSRNCRDN